MPPLFDIAVAVLIFMLLRARSEGRVQQRRAQSAKGQASRRPEPQPLAAMVAPMEMAEAWRTLGIAPGATRAQIQAAYRRAAHWCHPDKNPGNPVAEETFKRVNAAYRVLAG